MNGTGPAEQGASGSALPQVRGRIRAVVMGASAGGIEALSVLLPALPAAMPVPILIVMHLPREPSLLTRIFAPVCALAVVEAQDKEPVRGATVYFAPPDYHLLIEEGPYLALSVDDPVHYSRPSIDVLFASAADVYGAALMGIILSGANDDGTEGLAAVRRAGGLTVVQRPDSALMPFMVRSALQSGAAQLVLSLAEIAGLLRSLDGPDAATPNDVS